MPFTKKHTPWNKNMRGLYSVNKGENNGMYGKLPWNKGIKTGPNPEHSKRMKGRIPWNKGKPKTWVSSGNFKEGHIPWNKGKSWSQEIKDKVSQSKKGQTSWNKGKPHLAIRGKNHHNWKGGITPINKAIRESLEYEEWRKAVFERDLYTCKGCGKIGGWLEADHIKPFSLYPELRFDINNGRTLCKPCHKLLGWELFREANPMRKYIQAV